MRLYLLADRFMRQSHEVGTGSRDGADALAEDALPGSPPAHWLEMVRRHAPELYRSVISRQVAVAGRTVDTSSGHMTAANDLRDAADDTGRMPRSPARRDAAPDRRKWTGARRAIRRVLSRGAVRSESVEVPDAKRVPGRPRPEEVLSRSAPLQSPPYRAQTTPSTDPRKGDDPVLPSQVQAAGEPQAHIDGPHFTSAVQAPGATAIPRWSSARQPDAEELRPAAAPQRSRAMPDAGVAASSHAAPVFPAQVRRPVDEPFRSPGIPEDSRAADLAESPVARYPAMPSSTVSGGSGLHQLQVPETVSVQPRAARRWVSLPDPVEEAGVDGRWAALPDDSWTLPVHSGVPAGGLQGDGEVYGSDRHYFAGQPGSSWSE